MLRTTATVGILACILITVLLGGYRLHALNRDRAIEQNQQKEQHTADELAALRETELTAAARTLRVLATSLPPTPPARALENVLSAQDRCSESPCFTGLAVLDADGTPRHEAGRLGDLRPPELAGAGAWARDAANAGRVRTIISSPQPPSLVLITPVPASPAHQASAGRMVAAQIELDRLFVHHGRTPGPDWPAYATLVMKTDGTVVFHSQHPEMRLNNVYRRTARCAQCHTSFDHIERMLATEHGIVSYQMRGIDYSLAVAPLTLEGERWIVGVKMPRDLAVAALSVEMRQLAGVAALVVLLVLAAGVVTWRDGLRRLRAEAAASQQARLEQSHGELTALNAKLEHAAHEWRATVDTIDAALIVLEPSGVIQRMNLAAAATLPDALPSWLGRPSAWLVDYQPWSAALSLVGDAVANQVVVTGRVLDMNNRTWDLWCRAVPDQQRAAVLIIARDVTDIVELQESVRRSETMAQLGSIVSGVAHEVRNPLFAISSLVDAWAVQPHRDSTPFVDALRGEVGRLRTLMLDLLEYGRPAKSTRQAHGLHGIIHGAIRACSHEAEARRVRVVTEMFDDFGVMMDPRRLERVFINLIQNAVQHAPADSAVRVEVMPAADPSQASIAIRDSGPGIAPSDLPRLFTPFFSRRPGGFGLGLAITERIVSEHQGKVSAANHPAGGAVMTVWLPVIQARTTSSGYEVEVTC
ncbi:MAG: ATP-binding protein [Vicinamibacterales bacterium]